RARHLFAAGVGHDAEGAVLRAAFHDRHEGARALDARRRHRVELLDLGEGDIHLRAPALLARLDQAGQAVQGLRAKHHVYIGRALDDRLALLAGDAATDADDQPRLGLLEQAHPAEVVEHPLLRLLTHRTSV